MSAAQGNRRSTHVDTPVAYAAVGASKAPDLMRFPPTGMTPYEEALQLGSGQERFIAASSVLMTWGAQRAIGADVRDIDRGANDDYIGPEFDDDGQAQAAGEREEHFGPDGEPYVVAGTTAVIEFAGQKPQKVLVVYTIEEDHRFGFAWGTNDEGGALGEQLFMIEHREDGTVWAIARGLLAPSKNGLLGLKGRSNVKDTISSAKAQIEALAPGAAAGVTVNSVRTNGESASGETASRATASSDAAARETQSSQKKESTSTEPDVVTAEVVVQPGEAAAEAPGSTHQRRPSKSRS